MKNGERTRHARVKQKHEEIPQIFQSYAVPCKETVVVALQDAAAAEFTVVAPGRAPPFTGQTRGPLPVGVVRRVDVGLDDGD